MKTDDITGRRFGRLTVIRYVGGSKWECVCDCGNTKSVDGFRLKSGKTQSCGCKRKEIASVLNSNGRLISDESRAKMSAAKKGTPPRKDVLEKAWKSRRLSRNPENPCAKEWILISPDGIQYEVTNLSNFIRENANMFGIIADEQEIRKTAKMFAVLKWHMKHDKKQSTCCGGWSIILHEDERINAHK